MPEKKYLLSERDLKCLFHSAWDCMISEGNVVEFIKAHEYRERTCHMEKCEFADFAPEYEELHTCSKCGEQTAVLACVNDNGDTEWIKPRFCGYCGAKVTDDAD